jgi:hypothetical protein
MYKKMILKGLLLYTTILLCIVALMIDDAPFIGHIAYVTVCLSFIIACKKVLSKEDINRLTKFLG